MLNKDDVVKETYENIKKNRFSKQGYTSIIGQIVKRTKYLFFGLAMGAVALYGLSYYGFVDLKKKTGEKIIKEVENYVSNSNVLENHVKQSIDDKTQKLFEYGKDDLIAYTKTSLDGKVDSFFKENEKELKEHVKTKFDETTKENADNWYKEEKTKVQISAPKKSEVRGTIKATPTYSERHLNITSKLKNINSDIKYVIYVDKTNNRTKLIDAGSKKVVFDLKSSDGKGGNGEKYYKGDKKTPEGIYNIYLKKSPSSGYYNKLYGEVIFGICYPNSYDRSKGKTGSGILFCGTGIQQRISAIDSGYDASNGAVIMKDRDITRLYNQISGCISQTILVIEDKKRIVNPKNHMREIDAI